MTGSGFIYSWLGILLILPLPNQDRQHYTVEVGTIYTRLGILLILPLPNQVRHTSNSTSTKSGQATLKKYKTIYSWLGILLILPLPNQDRQHYKSKKLPCSQQQVILHHFTVSLEEGQVLATDKQDTIQIPFRYHLDTFQIPFRYLPFC